MRRLSTMMYSAAAAGLTALAVTVAVPAIADNAPTAKGDDEFPACIRAELDGAPADDRALKEWLGERMERKDAATHRALEKCAPEPMIEKRGPFEQELRACLKKHGVEVPGDDPRALKRWFLEHGDDARYRDALKACDMPPVIKRAGPVACDEKGAVVAPDGRGKEVVIFESGSRVQDKD